MMKTKQEQIDEIERTVLYNCNSHGRGKHCPERISKGLYKAGYRKASKVIDEFVERIMTDAEAFLSNMSRNIIRICASKMKKEISYEMRKAMEK